MDGNQFEAIYVEDDSLDLGWRDLGLSRSITQLMNHYIHTNVFLNAANGKMITDRPYF